MLSRKNALTFVTMLSLSVTHSYLVSAQQGGYQQTQTGTQQPASQQQTGPGGVPLGTPDAQGNVTVPKMTVEQAMAQGLAQVPQQPFPPLTPEEQSYLDQVLKVWQQRTDQIQRYQCKFRRYERNPQDLKDGYVSFSTGEIKFMQPDKGLFDVQVRKTIVDKVNVKYDVDPKNPYGEFWICDGRWVFIRDRNEKTEQQIELPPEMRGNQIYLSPLPFLFGVNAEEIKRRYWIRPVPVKGQGNGLEAWPRYPADRANYSRVTVVLDPTDILPKSLIVYKPNWTPQNDVLEVFEFLDRDTSSPGLLASIFQKSFIPKTPGGFKIDRKPYIDPKLQQQDVGRAAQAPQMQPGAQR